MNWDQIHFVVSEKNRRSAVLAQFQLNTIEIQTNFQQKCLVNATHCSLEIDSMEKFVNLFVEETAPIDRTSNFRYVDRNLLEVEAKTNSSGVLSLFDRLVDVLDEPRVDFSLRYFHLQYKASARRYSHLLDAAHFSLHNASKPSDDVQRAYTMKLQLDSQSTFLLHNLSSITVRTKVRFSEREKIVFLGRFRRCRSTFRLNSTSFSSSCTKKRSKKFGNSSRNVRRRKNLRPRRSTDASIFRFNSSNRRSFVNCQTSING